MKNQEIEIMEIQVSILREQLVNLKMLGELKYSLAIFKRGHAGFKGTSQIINAGRIRDLEKRVKMYTEMTEGI